MNPWDGGEGVRDEDREGGSRSRSLRIVGIGRKEEQTQKGEGKNARESAASTAVGTSTNGSAVRAQCLDRAAPALAALRGHVTSAE